MSDAEKNNEATKLSQGRSPAYPYIALGKALERVEQVYNARVGQNPYPPGTFYKVWGVGAKSSSARQTMAALNHFGLVDYVGRGDDRKVRLSDLALKIVQDKRPDSAERAAAIRKAALTPPIHQKLYDKFPPPMPDEVFIEHFLVSDSDYNENAAKSLMKEYADTIAFANMNQPGNMPDEDDGSSDADGQNKPDGIQFGVDDLINWESGGQIQWKQPRKIISIDDKDGEWFYQVEDAVGQKGWIPVEQAIPHPHAAPPARPAFTPPPVDPMGGVSHGDEAVVKEGSRKAVFPVEDGDVTLIFPENISKDGLAELGLYLNIFLNKEQKKADGGSNGD